MKKEVYEEIYYFYTEKYDVYSDKASERLEEYIKQIMDASKEEDTLTVERLLNELIEDECKDVCSGLIKYLLEKD